MEIMHFHYTIYTDLYGHALEQGAWNLQFS